MRCARTRVISSGHSGEGRSAFQVRGEGFHVNSNWTRVQLNINKSILPPIQEECFRHAFFVIGSADPWPALAWRSCVPVARCCPLCLSIFPVVSSFFCVVHVCARFQRPETVALAQDRATNITHFHNSGLLLHRAHQFHGLCHAQSSRHEVCGIDF